tara:strand:- start:291 stop:1610 length:1320 start_codon:yes stop_codon:yes gene_type:complete
MDNLFNRQTVPVTDADIKNAGIDPSNCIHAEHISDNSITYEQQTALYKELPDDTTLDDDYEGCYMSQTPGTDEVDTSIKVKKGGKPEKYILHTNDISHLKTTPFNKLLKNMMNSLLLTIVIAVIICASSFWLNHSECISVLSNGICSEYIGENNEPGEKPKLIDYLFPSNLWNWPYCECDASKLSGGSMNYDEKNINFDIQDSDHCKTDIPGDKFHSNVFPYSFLRNLEEDYKDYNVLKVIPKYSLTLVLCVMLVYRKIVKLIIKKGITINKSLKDNTIGRLLIIILSIISFLLIVGFIHNVIIPGISILILLVILLKHLYDLHSITKANITEYTNPITKKASVFLVGAVITGILILIFYLGDIKELDLVLNVLAFFLYLGSTYNGYLVVGTCLMILCAIAAVVARNIIKAKPDATEQEDVDDDLTNNTEPTPPPPPRT